MLGDWLGAPDGTNEGRLLSKIVGSDDGFNKGCVLGMELGLSEGTVLAHVSQHIVSTVSNEHLYAESSFPAQAQSCCSPPSSRTLKVVEPAASPLHAEQQLSQQFRATSGSAHLSAMKFISETAHKQFCSSLMKEM